MSAIGTTPVALYMSGPPNNEIYCFSSLFRPSHCPQSNQPILSNSDSELEVLQHKMNAESDSEDVEL